MKEKINFDLKVDTNLLQNEAISKANIETSIGNLSTQNSVYNLKDNSFNSDYLINIASLANLKDILDMNLKGKLDVNGEISNKDHSIAILGKADTLGGAF